MFSKYKKTPQNPKVLLYMPKRLLDIQKRLYILLPEGAEDHPPAHFEISYIP